MFMEFAACRASDVQKLKCLFNSTIFVLLVASGAPTSASAAQAPTAQAHPPADAAELIKALQSRNLAEREQTAKAAAGIAPLPEAVVSFLLNALRGLESQPSNNSVSEATREQWRYSGDLVTALGHAGSPAIPDLSVALNDPDEAIRRGAVDALILIARDSPAAWPVLIRASQQAALALATSTLATTVSCLY